ncbi:hypothetical protein [Pseudomonas putida]|uniref:hypothetical protein n=1 Tax=Pseudomonas putida TaxID=303 RepID=UPI002B24F961|nr:hypothetical protein [Pseudomonas putida]
MSGQAQGKLHSQDARLIRNISQYLDRALSQWLASQPQLSVETKVEIPDLWGSLMSVAVAHARCLVGHFQIPSQGEGLELFLDTCHERFLFPDVQPAFPASTFLQRVTLAEWVALANDLQVPIWVAEEVKSWGKRQGLQSRDSGVSAGEVAPRLEPKAQTRATLGEPAGKAKKYNVEKVLWFASEPKGLHVSPNESARFSDLDEIVESLVEAGQLEEASRDSTGTYYRCTHSGLIAHFELKLKYRTSQGKSTAEVEAKLAELRGYDPKNPTM